MEGHAGRGARAGGGGICAGTRAASRPGSPCRGRIRASAAAFAADGRRDEAQVGGVAASRDSRTGRTLPSLLIGSDCPFSARDCSGSPIPIRPR